MAGAAESSVLHEIIQSLENIKSEMGPQFRRKGRNLHFRYFTNKTIPTTVHVQVSLRRNLPVILGMAIHSQSSLDDLSARLDEILQHLEQ